LESLGEAELTVMSTIVGKVRVLNIFPDSALFPRLGLTLGVTLHDRPQAKAIVGSPAFSLVNYEMRDGSGELRLSQHGDAVGPVIWAGPRRFVRSSDYGSENQLRFVCDLDHWRLEEIERRRDGAAPRFWFQVWPVLMSSGDVLDADVPSFELRVPRELWLEFYSKVGGSQFDVLEIRFKSHEAEQFRRAIAKTREARSKIATGDYDEAVGLCRKVIEALMHELPTGAAEPLEALFMARTDERRTKEYLGIISKLKQLAGFAHHDFGIALTYSRTEAQFIVRLTEAMLSLVGELSQNA
jgi:hypothetical protein